MAGSKKGRDTRTGTERQIFRQMNRKTDRQIKTGTKIGTKTRE